MSRNRTTILFAICVVCLAACSGSPRQIASYAQEKTVATANHPSSSYIYDAYLEMEVRQPESSAERATELAQDYGGHLDSSQAWWVDGEQQISLELSVPAFNFDRLYAALQRLGTVNREHVYGRWDGDGDGWRIYSQITLELQQRPSAWPRISLGDWHPLDTLQEAWHVTTVLLGFLLDVLIWALVVTGPFILLGLGVRKLYKKVKA